MPDRMAKLYHDGDGKSGQSVHSFQSVWMSHWTHTSFTVAPCVQDRLSLRVGKNNDRDSPSAKGFTEVTEARTVGIMNEGQTSSKKEIDERLDCQPFPMFRVCPNIGSGLHPKFDPDISFDARAPRPQIDCDVQSTQILPYKFGSGKTPVSSFFTSKQELNKLNSVLSSKDHLSDINFTTLGHKHNGYHDPSAISVCEKKLDNHSIPAKSGTSVFGQSHACQSLQDPFARDRRLPIFFGECSKKMQKCVAEGFPNSSHFPEASKAESSYHGGTTNKMPGYVHDMETMRICTTNSVEGLDGGPGAFSQTTHNLLFLKKTDVSLSKEKQTFRESKVSTKLKGDVFGELLSLSLPSAQNQQRLKLQPLGSSKEGEGENNTEGVETPEVGLKNESSAETAETDTMYMDAFKWQNYLSGVNSSPSNKDILTGQNPSYQQAIPSSEEEVGHGCPITALPEVLVLPAAGISLDNEEAATSRTQSLNAEHLLSHSENPTELKSTHCPDGPTGLDPGSRWLKRLKLSGSDSLALGTKSSNSDEPPTHEKVNKLFSKISSSDTRSHKNHGEEERANYQAAIVLLNGESSSLESAKKGQDKLLSHPWIRRWCRDQTHQLKKAGAVVVCEPQSTKMEFDDLQNKQFPSIAAMALMGKAMSGFQPCKFQRNGSFVVWNIKGF